MCSSIAAIRTVITTPNWTFSGLPDNLTFGICNDGCYAPCAIIAAPTLGCPGCIMADWSRAFDDPIPLPRGRQLVTLKDAANHIQKFPRPSRISRNGRPRSKRRSW
jgi:hypothetical protein